MAWSMAEQPIKKNRDVKNTKVLKKM